jgi:hypothetical protein
VEAGKEKIEASQLDLGQVQADEIKAKQYFSDRY